MDLKIFALLLGFILSSACKTKDGAGKFQGASPIKPGITRADDGGFVGTPEKQDSLSKWSAPDIEVFRVPIAGSEQFAIGLKWNLIEDTGIVNEVSLCNGPKCWTIKTTKNMSIYYAIPKEWEGANLTAFVRHCPDEIGYKKIECSPAGETRVNAEHFPGLSENENLLQAMDIEQDAIEQGVAVHAVITQQSLSLTDTDQGPKLSLLKNIANQGPYAFSESILSWEEEAAFIPLLKKNGSSKLALVEDKRDDQNPFTKDDLRAMSADDQKSFAVVYRNPAYCGHMRFVQNTENLLNALGGTISKGEVKECLAKVENGEGGQKKVNRALYIGSVISLAIGSGLMLLAIISHYPKSRLVLFPVMALANFSYALFAWLDGDFNFRDFFGVIRIGDGIIDLVNTAETVKSLKNKAIQLDNFATEQIKGLGAKEARIVLNNPDSPRAKNILNSREINLSPEYLAKASSQYKAKNLELEKDLRLFREAKTNRRIGGVGVIAAAIGATLYYKSTNSYNLTGKKLSPSESNFDENLSTSLEGIIPLLKKRMTLLVPNYR